MDKILNALGKQPTAFNKFALFGLFSFVTLGFSLLMEMIGQLTQLSFVVIHGVTWALWFCWQGWWFPANRRRHLKQLNAYRHAFWCDIVPGVSLGVALMTRPLVHAIATSVVLRIFGSAALALSVLLIGCGSTLLLFGFRAIGLACVGFLYEYLPGPSAIKQNGVYTYLRHPLFFGGVLVSLGSALLIVEPVSPALGIINFLALPIYRYLEDRRCLQIFGSSLIDYHREVPAFLPKLQAIGTKSKGRPRMPE